MKRGIHDGLRIFLKGLLMGLADTVPGVSGGTIAFITGIYQRLIAGISHIAGLAFKVSRPKELAEGIKEIDFRLFVPLGIGIGTAIIFFSRIMHYLLIHQEAVTFAFFFGLILASAIIVFKRIKRLSPAVFLIGFSGFLCSFALIGLGITTSLGHSYLVIFASGAIAVCAMILPGISGAFLLLLLGQYDFFVSALHDLDLAVIAIAGIGGVSGLLLFSRLLKYLFARFPGQTLGFLAGLMLGSLRLTVERTAGSFTSALPIAIAAVAGFMLVLVVEAFGKE